MVYFYPLVLSIVSKHTLIIKLFSLKIGYKKTKLQRLTKKSLFQKKEKGC